MKCKYCGWNLHYGDQCENIADSPYVKTRPSGCYEREITALKTRLAALEPTIPCPECQDGKTMRMECYGGPPIEVWVDCDLCNGSGVIERSGNDSQG